MYPTIQEQIAWIKTRTEHEEAATVRDLMIAFNLPEQALDRLQIALARPDDGRHYIVFDVAGW